MNGIRNIIMNWKMKNLAVRDLNTGNIMMFPDNPKFEWAKIIIVIILIAFLLTKILINNV